MQHLQNERIAAVRCARPSGAADGISLNPAEVSLLFKMLSKEGEQCH